MSSLPVSFPDWKAALARTNLSPAVQAAYRREIITFLHHCKVRHAAACVDLLRQYLEIREKQSTVPARDALRWFYREGSRLRRRNQTPMIDDGGGHCGPEVPPMGRAPPFVAKRGEFRPMEPKPAAQDLGGPEWAEPLVKTMRLRGHLWHTEETYRNWGRRFAAFIVPKAPCAAGAKEVGAFLTDLAVRSPLDAPGL